MRRELEWYLKIIVMTALPPISILIYNLLGGEKEGVGYALLIIVVLIEALGLIEVLRKGP